MWFAGCFILYEPQLGTPDWAQREGTEGLVLRRDAPGGSGLWTGWQRERQDVGESHVVNTYPAEPARCGNKVVFSRDGISIRRFSPSLQSDRSKICSVRPSSNIFRLDLGVDLISVICIKFP